MNRETVLLISDIHTNYHVINAQIEHAEESCGNPIGQVFVLGDFGFFGTELNDYFRRHQNDFLRPVFCIEGNHEDHGALQKLTAEYADVISHLQRGAIHPLGQWRGLCIGGARYMDILSTPRGCEITSDDIAACLAHSPDAVDLVLSHDCPGGLGVPGALELENCGAPGEPLLDGLAGHFHPRWWFFGHHHRWFDLEKDGTRYIGLPQSWVGYVLLHADGEVLTVHHTVPIDSRSWWKRMLGLK